MCCCSHNMLCVKQCKLYTFFNVKHVNTICLKSKTCKMYSYCSKLYVLLYSTLNFIVIVFVIVVLTQYCYCSIVLSINFTCYCIQLLFLFMC